MKKLFFGAAVVCMGVLLYTYLYSEVTPKESALLLFRKAEQQLQQALTTIKQGIAELEAARVDAVTKPMPRVLISDVELQPIQVLQ